MTILKAEFVANYKAAEQRATPCALGIAFSVDDRISLTRQRLDANLTLAGAANEILSRVGGSYNTHYSRFQYWEEQIKRGHIYMGYPAAATPSATKFVKTEPAYGRIKSKADVQGVVNACILDMVKIGITNESEAITYVSNGFQFARNEQKIDHKATRILDELRIGDLTKDQALSVLDRIKAQL